jgi:hypothetical protein
VANAQKKKQIQAVAQGKSVLRLWAP